MRPALAIMAAMAAATLLLAPARGSAPALAKFALQVGINAYDPARGLPALDGCRADVAAMRSVLVHRFGFPPQHIRTLLDAQATHAAIVAAFRSQLIENAKRHRDAVVVFQYSGHGSTAPDRGRHHASQYQDTLVPFDSRDGVHFDITSDELHALLAELCRYTANVTFILDSCHSGAFSRNGPPEPGVKVRWAPPDPHPRPREPGLAVTSADMLGDPRRYTAIAACLPSERACETEAGGGHHGELTWLLVQELQRGAPGTTWRELMGRVADRMSADNPGQHPQLEGDRGRVLFAGVGQRAEPYLAIRGVSGREVVLDAGAAQGIVNGTFVAVYAASAHRLEGSRGLLGHARVVRVEPFTAVARMAGTQRVTVADKAVLTAPGFGSERLRAVAPPALLAGLRAAVAASEAARNLVEVAGADAAGAADWQAAVRRGRFADIFPRPEDVLTGTQPPPSDALVYYLAAPGGTPLLGWSVPTDAPDACARLTDGLVWLARQANLKALENRASALQGKVVLRAGRLDESGSAYPYVPHDYLPRVCIGDHYGIEIANRSHRPLYPTLLDVGTDGKIVVMYPPPGGGVALPAGRSVYVRGFRIVGPPGVETFKLIATTQPADFDFLRQGTLAAAGREVPQNALEALIDEAYGGRRDFVRVRAPEHDWTTASLQMQIMPTPSDAP